MGVLAERFENKHNARDQNHELISTGKLPTTSCVRYQVTKVPDKDTVN